MWLQGFDGMYPTLWDVQPHFFICISQRNVQNYILCSYPASDFTYDWVLEYYEVSAG